MKTIIILLLTMAAVAAGQAPENKAAVWNPEGFAPAGSAALQKPTVEPPTTAITVAALEARLAELEQGKAQALANLHAYEGAIQECRYWLDLAKKAKAVEAAKPAPEPAKEKPETPKPKPGTDKRPAP